MTQDGETVSVHTPPTPTCDARLDPPAFSPRYEAQRTKLTGGMSEVWYVRPRHSRGALTRAWRIAPGWVGENDNSLTILFPVETWEIPC